MNEATIFHCCVCGSPAARVALSREVMLAESQGTLSIGGFVSDTSRHAVVDAATYDGLQKALTSASARDLHRIASLWAPFYCPDCDASYCREHWVLEVEFDDDFMPGWYDCTWGTCPKGHRRMVND